MRSEKPQSDNSAQVDDREGGSVDQSKGDKELEDATAQWEERRGHVELEIFMSVCLSFYLSICLSGILSTCILNNFCFDN